MASNIFPPHLAFAVYLDSVESGETACEAFIVSHEWAYQDHELMPSKLEGKPIEVGGADLDKAYLWVEARPVPGNSSKSIARLGWSFGERSAFVCLGMAFRCLLVL